MAGIFGLGEVRTEQVNNTWPEDPNFGYFAGGADISIQFCTIERLEFSNETVSSPGNYQLTRARRYFAAVSNNSYGYFGGGQQPPASCIIDRLDFSNETVGLPGNNFDANRVEHAGVSSPDYGYFSGSQYSIIINRLDFESETLALLPAELTQGRRNMSTVSSSNYGYFGCGEVPAIPREQCTIDRLDFSNETVSGPSSHGMNLSQARTLVGTVSGSDYGYFAGGRISPPTTYYNTIDRLDFSSETMSLPGNNLTPSRAFIAGVSNSNYGYLGAGGLPQSDIIDRLDFSTETTSVSPATLTQARYGTTAVPSGTSGTTIRHLPKTTGTDIDGKPISSTYGYFAGAAPINCTIERLDFSTETTVAPGDYTLTQARARVAAVSNSNYGYFGGGGAYVCTIDRLDFSNETIVAPGTYQLTQNRRDAAGFSNSNYGYFAGGEFPRRNRLDRIEFNTETTSNPSSNLSQNRGLSASFSSSSHGYVIGGDIVPGASCRIDRIDFSTETIDILYSPTARSRVRGFSNSNYGYFHSDCTINRLDFSNENISLLSDGFPSRRNNAGSVSTLNYGYIAGGRPPDTCTISRLDFTDDTLSEPTSLTRSQAYFQGVSN